VTRQRHTLARDGQIAIEPTGPAPPKAASTVSSIMSSAPYCVHKDVGVDAIASLLLARGFSAVPVVDAAGHALGMISKTDLLRHAHARGATDARAGDVMTPLAFVVPEDRPIGAAAALMAAEGVHRLPVIDREGAVVGILSALDLVAWVGGLAGYRV
jgi:CBS domain-containing protein